MLTPQEIQERSNSLEKAVFGGYSVSAVEDLLIPLQQDYANLYKENAVLKSKMKVLVDRIEEYRGKEESMNRAILTAQKTADDLVAETERKCAAMVADSELRLRQRSEDLQKEIQKESEEAERAKEQIRQEVQAEREKADQLKADLQRELQAEAQKAVKARTDLHKEVLAENQRVGMAQKAAADFIMEMEERFQQQLSQLERIKQMELKIEENELEKPEPKAAPNAAPKAPLKPAPKAAPNAAPKAPLKPAPQEPPKEPVVREKPQPTPTESEISRQIEANISRIMAASAQAEDIKRPEPSGDTQIIKPV